MPRPEFSIQEISLVMARDMVNAGSAGFYANRAQSPIAHDTFMCIYANGRWWLVGNGEFKLRDMGITIIPGTEIDEPDGWVRTQIVEVDDEHPIVRRLLRDANMSEGPDLPWPVSRIVANLGGERGK